MRKIKLHWQILIAIAVAVCVGWLANEHGGSGVSNYSLTFEFIGKLFLNALRMLIVPLITSSIIVGVAGIGGSGSLGRLGIRTASFYLTTTLAAILVGLVLVNVLKPGLVNGVPVGDKLALVAESKRVATSVESKGAGDVKQVFLNMVPPNIFAAAAQGQMLGLITFSLLFGYFIAKLPRASGDIARQFWSGIFHTMMMITKLVMKFAPLGIFGLVAATVAKTGLDAARPLLMFSVTVLIGLMVHAFLTLPMLLRFIAKVHPIAAFLRVGPALLTAFSTASSSATLPVTMECVERQIGVSNRISSFVLPLGATVNMNGTALYECTAAIFLAQAYGLHLTFSVQFTVVVIALLTSIGVAGVPSASLIAIAIILSAVGLPTEAIGVLLVFDRILDMARSAVNVLGDSVCTILIAHLEGEHTLIDYDT